MENNKATIKGRMGGKAVIYITKGEFRCDIPVHVSNNTPKDYMFKVRAVNEKGVDLYLAHFPGREVEVTGYLKVGSRGRTVIMLEEIQMVKAPLEAEDIQDRMIEKFDTLKELMPNWTQDRSDADESVEVDGLELAEAVDAASEAEAGTTIVDEPVKYDMDK